MPCNNECKLGCSGPSPHQCVDCRANKIFLSDVEKILNKKLSEFENSKLTEHIVANLNNSTVGKELNELEIKKRKFRELKNLNSHMENSFAINHMIDAYIKYLDNRDNDTQRKIEEIVICISDCPYEMPHKNKNNFCSVE